MCVVGREERREGVVVVVMVGGWVLCLSFPSAVSLGMTGLYQGKRMIGGIGHVLFSTCSQTDNGEDPLVTFGEPL